MIMDPDYFEDEFGYEHGEWAQTRSYQVPLKTKDENADVEPSSDVFEVFNKIESTQIKVEELRKLPAESSPVTPVLSEPFVDQHFKEAGKAIDVCPHEIKCLMEHVDFINNPMAAAAFKKFVMIAKLSVEAPLGKVRSELGHKRTEHADRLKAWKANLARIARKEKRRQQSIEAGERLARDTWFTMIDQLQNQLIDLNGSPKMANFDKWLIQALWDILGVKAISQTKNGPRVSFATCKRASISQIRSIHSRVTQLKGQYDEDNHKNWFHHVATDVEIHRMMRKAMNEGDTYNILRCGIELNRRNGRRSMIYNHEMVEDNGPIGKGKPDITYRAINSRYSNYHDTWHYPKSKIF